VTLFANARKIDVSGIVDDFWMTVADGVITATGTGTPPLDDETVDLDGDWLAPGFIDLHCHGGAGASVEDGAAGIATLLGVHRAAGTTRSVLSLVANPVSSLEASLDVIASLAAGDPLVLGAHVEGPFLAQARRGAHNGEYLLAPSTDVASRLLDAARGHLVQLTLAPELPGALDVVSLLAEAGVTVAVGHTEATFDETIAAFDRGARLVTHAFNAMPGIHHRAPGPVVAALEDERATLELILDGEHVDTRVASLVFASAPHRVALVTDAMAAAGSEDGDYRLGSLNVAVRDGRALLRGTSTIAGSTLTQDRALRIAIQDAGIDPVDAVAALTCAPARAIGRDSASSRSVARRTPCASTAGGACGACGPRAARSGIDLPPPTCGQRLGSLTGTTTTVARQRRGATCVGVPSHPDGCSPPSRCVDGARAAPSSRSCSSWGSPRRPCSPGSRCWLLRPRPRAPTPR
jgi:N-acetylglucosamine-6-phosphate deacetylase